MIAVRSRFLGLLAAAPAAAVLAAGCGAARPGSALPLPARTTDLPASTSSHVVVILMENEEATDVIGSGDAPFVNRLARANALATRYYAVGHPSLPNYLALTGGSTFGIHSDCTDCTVAAANLVDQLEQSRVSWKAYMEGLPRPCDTTANVGEYAKKHDPFLYYRDVVGSPGRCGHVVPYTQLAPDLRSGHLPTFVWITPNLCDDGHDCLLRQADRYLSGIVPALLRELGPHGVLLLTWDEGSSDRGCCGGQAAGGRVATIAAGPDVRHGGSSGRAFDHYSLLRTVEDALGLAHLGRAASAAALDALFTRPPRVRLPR